MHTVDSTRERTRGARDHLPANSHSHPCTPTPTHRRRMYTCRAELKNVPDAGAPQAIKAAP